MSTGRIITIVCCHSIWLGGSTQGLDESEWLLEPFQAGEHVILREHVDLGIRVARDAGGELWFSGGPTKRDRTERSEGSSYLALAQTLLAAHSLNGPVDFSLHADDFATDSFQNILFPLLQSHSIAASSRHGTDPNHRSLTSRISRINIVGHGFKAVRFKELHLPALGFSESWILDNVRYIGTDAAKGPEVDEGERRAVGDWKEVSWGDIGELARKRVSRGWTDKRRDQMEVVLRKRGLAGEELGWMSAVLNGERLEVARRVTVASAPTEVEPLDRSEGV